ncbi:MAG: hypothetical protein LBI02_06935 [Opitutaceae bacterium]|jgi:glucosamine-6-phosphate deaminase|nr:hypothetical protein [Opitutaceae bacterium]
MAPLETQPALPPPKQGAAEAESLVQVPGERKAPAVRAALRDAISTACPASILRLHPRASLYLDPAAASLLPPEAI